MVIGGVLAIGALVGVFIIFSKPINRVIDKLTDPSDAELAATAAAASRDQKGALCNSFDFLFGEGACQSQRASTELNNQVEAQAKEVAKQAAAVGLTPTEFEQATDTNRTDITKFNPSGLIGYGIDSINGGKGIADTPENRLAVDSILNPIKIPEKTINEKTFGVFG